MKNYFNKKRKSLLVNCQIKALMKNEDVLGKLLVKLRFILYANLTVMTKAAHVPLHVLLDWI